MMIKNAFITGVVILLPVTITVWIGWIVFKALSTPFYQLIYFALYPLLKSEKSLILLSFLSSVISFIFPFLVAFVVGYFAESLLIKPITKGIDRFFKKIPLINRVYHAVDDTVRILLHTEGERGFSKVVIVPFPSEGRSALGMIPTKEHTIHIRGKDYKHVLITGTPNPFMGFLVLYPQEMIKVVNVKVEEALQFTISGGIITPESFKHELISKDFY